MFDNLVKLGELGATTILALVLLVGILLVAYFGYYFMFRLLPKLHSEAMAEVRGMRTEVAANLAEQKNDRFIAEQRHEEVMLKLQEMHRDFLSNSDTGEHKPVVGDKRTFHSRPQEAHA